MSSGSTRSIPNGAALAERLGLDPERVRAALGRLEASIETIEEARRSVRMTIVATTRLEPWPLLAAAAGSLPMLVRRPGLLGLVAAELVASRLDRAVLAGCELVDAARVHIAMQEEISAADDAAYGDGFLSRAGARRRLGWALAGQAALLALSSAERRSLIAELTDDEVDRLIDARYHELGALEGIPFAVRGEANRRLAEAILRRGAFDDGVPLDEDERAYLGRVVSGDVVLVAFDPAAHRFVEALNLEPYAGSQAAGVPASSVVTYVPGTFTTDSSVYRGELRDLPERLAKDHPETVVLVYKGGRFPGDARGTSDPLAMVSGLLEANDEHRGLAAGADLAEFQRSVEADPALAGADAFAIGHSWGLADVAASEVAGAHYDAVISLAGAWVPAAWEPDAQTVYRHHAYEGDLLGVAQAVRLPIIGPVVGEGRTPDVLPAFGSAGPFVLPEAAADLGGAARHSLIASADTRNQQAIDAIERELWR